MAREEKEREGEREAQKNRTEILITCRVGGSEEKVNPKTVTLFATLSVK